MASESPGASGYINYMVSESPGASGQGNSTIIEEHLDNHVDSFNKAQNHTKQSLCAQPEDCGSWMIDLLHPCDSVSSTRRFVNIESYSISFILTERDPFFQ